MGKQYENALAVARMCPLAASILAPLASLMAIPALSQAWYSNQGNAVPDSKSTIVLAALSLALTLLANGFLVMRFSRAQTKWKLLTTVSTFMWVLTTIIQIANLIVGAKTIDQEGYEHEEGFWCAVWSVILSGTCAVSLSFHFTMEAGRPPEDEIQIRLTGQHFMYNILALLFIVGIEALIFSKIEGWEFFDGVYFAVVTMLTIGFGDLLPTYASTRVLLVPFALCTISLLANIVSMIVQFISALTDVRRQRWRTEYEKRAEAKFGDDGSRPAQLQDEVTFLNKLGAKESNLSQMFDLATSFVALIVFWFVGAVIFCKMEDWTYGVSLYFCYVFFLTLGYGDYAPRTAAGRTFFVLYSLLAVPIIASFALQAVSNVVTSFTEQRFDAQKLEAEHGEETVKPHSEFILERHAELDHELDAFRAAHKNEPEDVVEQQFERKLVADMITYACSLEAQARRIMMNQMPQGGQPQVLLRADRNQQLRDMRSLGLNETELRKIMDVETDGDSSVLQQTVAYRRTFAKFLATGSRLQELRGIEQEAFERRRGFPGEDVGGGKVKTGGGDTSLAGFVDAQEASLGPGGRGDNQDDAGDKRAARKQADEGRAGSGMMQALNSANV